MSDKYRAQCWGKQRYGTRALAVAGRQEWADRKERPALLWLVSPYECPFCHSFHLGRSKANRKRYIAHVREQMAADAARAAEGSR